MEAIFHLFKIVSDSTRVDQQMFCWFKAYKVIFHWGHLSLRSSSIEVVFHFFKIFKIDLYSTRVDLPMLKSKFCSFPAISLLALCLPQRSSSMEVVFHFFKIFKIYLYSTRVDLPMLNSKFCSFPAISLLARVGGGWGVGGEKLKIKLNSAQLELDLGLSLAKFHFMTLYCDSWLINMGYFKFLIRLDYDKL